MSARTTRKRARTQDDGEDNPPAKRESGQEILESVSEAPAQDDSAGDGQSIEQDEEFWFEDGTVILVSLDVEFRVYQGVLAALSPVFKALFAERDHELRDVPLGGNQTFQCPVVRVADSPEDLRHLLRSCFSKRLGRSVDLLKLPIYSN